MLARRLLVLVAVMLALGAVAASIAPRDLRAPRTAPSLPAPLPAAPLPGRELAPSVDASTVRPPTVVARVGDHVRLSIRARETGALTIAALDSTQPVDPYSPAIFDFVADRAGSFPVVVDGTAVRVATLRVTAR